TDAAGESMSKLRSGTRVTVTVQALSSVRTLRNVIAETPGGDPGNVVMAGAHLDSVIDGPGINDDGSGVATLMGIGEELATGKPKNKVRFAFWAGEEYGLLGSRHYVDGLTDDERGGIAVYLNFDMLASPNYAPLVYDDTGAPHGSADVTRLLLDLLKEEGVQGERIDLAGRSDHYAFEQAGIPVGGLFSGAEEIKSDEEARRYGGEANEPFDACYHQACDDISNISNEALADLSKVAAAAVAAFANGAAPGS
ncbi:MAG: hypothetical protein QOH90_1863, partial [Actinomycetota bacterium]|nr:hypothetical protein [Actinomycetota bacterium]